jgi:hypothetical protein
MRLVRTHTLLNLVLLILIALPGFAAQQESKTVLATANGTGTLKIGQEQFKISTVVIKLLENGKAEITLVSDITVFVNGSWARDGDSQGTIKLEITGTATGGGFEGHGGVLLKNEGKSIERLWLQGASKTRKTAIEVSFHAE